MAHLGVQAAATGVSNGAMSASSGASSHTTDGQPNASTLELGDELQVKVRLRFTHVRRLVAVMRRHLALLR